MTGKLISTVRVTRLSRRLRGLRPDRNPLRRGWDRAEAAVLAGLAAAFLIGAPLTTLLTWRAVYTAGLHTVHAQQAARHQVRAVLLTSPAPLPGWYGIRARARWTAPDGTPRTGEIPAPASAQTGSTVTVWTGTSGQLTNPPLLRAQAASQAVLAAMLAPLTLGLLLAGAGMAAHGALDRRRFATWDAAAGPAAPRPGIPPGPGGKPGRSPAGPAASRAAGPQLRPVTRHQPSPAPTPPPSFRARSASPIAAEPDRAGLLTDWRSSPRRADRADCCPARPAVMAIMPPAPGRPRPADLLLCGHHYRVHARALAAAGAAAFSTGGEPLALDPFLPVQVSGDARS